MLYLAIFFLLAALVLFWHAHRRRKAAGLPGGQVIYSDMRGWGIVEKPFYDASLGLTGKPDYLIRQGEQIIPVEVKSTRNERGPYDSHIYQLAAYCLLVHKVMGKRPAYGILRYGDLQSGTTYSIKYTPDLETSLIDLLAEMRHQEHRKEVNRSHDSPARCARCGFRSICDQRLH
jgi:CRISPR-associated exonuclease Cas4